MDREALETALLDAHNRNVSADLVRLYTLAGDQEEQKGDIQAACFYLTHAFIYALEAGAREADDLNRRLADHGRAERLDF